MTDFIPRASNSRWQNARSKNPRSSVRRSRSMMKAPLSLVSLKITSHLQSALSPDAVICNPLVGCARTVPQVLRQEAGRHQGLDMADALVTRALKLLECELRFAIGRAQLLGAAADVPLRFEGGQQARDLVEADAIGAGIGAGVCGEFESAAGHHVGHNGRNVADAIVVPRLADVKGLVEHQLLGSFQRGDEGP